MADQYDARGNIWRLSQSWIVNHYQVPVLWQTGTAVYDVQNGRYVAKGLTNEYEAAEFDVPLERRKFTPQALRRRGRR